MMKVLYICTHNRCRSILSEAVTNHFASPWITARSAGSSPVGEVHPLSLRYLSEAGIATENLQSQSWHEFESFAPDVVITVCDSAASEACPLWFGDSLVIHWGLSDPSKLDGTDEELAAAFNQTIDIIKARVEVLLGIAKSEPESWREALRGLAADTQA